MARLHGQIVAYFQQHLAAAEIFLPWSAQQMRGKIYANCTVREDRSDDEGTFFRIRGKPDDVERLSEQFGQPVAERMESGKIRIRVINQIPYGFKGISLD